jgi:hypothetical protein
MMIKFFKTSAVVVGLTIAGTAFTCNTDGSGGFLPENDLKIPADSKMAAGITEAQFMSVIDRIEAIYEPVISGLGVKLTIQRKWSDATVNANASQSGKVWNVNMYGGLARHETITEDGFALVLCHELGHHIGGAPRKAGLFGGSWASNEGQADYFANLKCLRKTFLNDDNIAIVAALNAPKALTDACNKAYAKDKDDAAICIRGGMAGKSVANLFSVLSKLPDTLFDSPDANVVKKTDDNHPKAQCRLDTYFQGSLCDIGMNDEVSQKDETVGTCNISTGHKLGNRPFCWFKPKKM